MAPSVIETLTRLILAAARAVTPFDPLPNNETRHTQAQLTNPFG